MSHASQNVVFPVNDLFQTTFKSYQTNKTFKIRDKVNCKSSFVFYLLECYILNIQYVGQSETSCNIRVNNYRKDIKNPNVILAFKHLYKHKQSLC